MANLLGRVNTGTAPESRHLLESMQDSVRVFPWLNSTKLDNGTLSVDIAAISAAPISVSRNAAGDYCFVIGHMFPDLPKGRSPAGHLLSTFAKKGIHGFEADGDFYLACLHLSSGELLISTDSLGIFPLYYGASKNTFIFSTTANIVRLALGLTPSLSVEGLVGILLTMHIVGEQTIWDNVYRAKAGHVIRWTKESQLSSHPINTISASTEHFGKPLQDCQRLYHNTLVDICRFPSDNIALLLSGGLDSRLIAGYLAHNHKSGFPCYTLGAPTDNEFYCAQGVAKALSLSHIGVSADETSEDEAVKLATLQIDMESMGNGFNDLSWWDTVHKIKGSDRTLYNGFVGDSCMGGTHIPWAYDNKLKDYTFQMMFEQNNRWGLSPHQIKQLFVQRALGQYLEQNIETLKSMFDNANGLPFQKAWSFDLVNRQRFHVGACIWRLSFSFWPRIPFADKRLINVSAGMPGAVMLERWTQKNILRTMFPSLSRLPLDRNSPNLSPLTQPSLSARSKLKIEQFARDHLKRNGVDNRYYYRVFDFNNRTWRAVQNQAARYDTPLPDLIDPVQFRALTSDKRETLAGEDGIVGGSSLKTLLALKFLTARNL